MKHLVLGGVRSGKSAFAQEQIAACAKPVCYVATSQVWDDEMASQFANIKTIVPKSGS
ncbi:bifunctional adenosylcobinamide kinase/adenosylcobinamide-phosphate guanylyltransferase [Marinomonas sp. KJ51-3]|uniref:Adenosylcobinamide kinase n=1 Tax=Marinomonas rhodophyticola TaxID=2992803 RepID=A0ABT3KDM5_9GAMM|nr:bifunctional adenosylcobinamide kinase/adenosylcobinamide-phosphate guanylyltransferase [Marinomonas sp. KJ51-3]MCW4628645.1 bifunctional adenosylcobinamide kinase/adenosylcobinamide-phosphate guanylyltransferase [Marinomonas sp. KJ51-3]